MVGRAQRPPPLGSLHTLDSLHCSLKPAAPAPCLKEKPHSKRGREALIMSEGETEEKEGLEDQVEEK